MRTRRLVAFGLGLGVCVCVRARARARARCGPHHRWCGHHAQIDSEGHEIENDPVTETSSDAVVTSSSTILSALSRETEAREKLQSDVGAMKVQLDQIASTLKALSDGLLREAIASPS